MFGMAISLMVGLNSGVAKATDYSALYASVEPSLCTIGRGSCFVVGDGSYIVTNQHVLEGASSLPVDFEDGFSSSAALIIAGSGLLLDLAVLKLQVKRKPLELCAQAPLPGSEVLAIGNPYDRKLGVRVGMGMTVGHVSRVDSMEGMAFIRHNADISPGNSGGPLLSGSGGCVLGVNTLKSADATTDGLFWALGAENILTLLNVDEPSTAEETYRPEPTRPADTTQRDEPPPAGVRRAPEARPVPESPRPYDLPKKREPRVDRFIVELGGGTADGDINRHYDLVLTITADTQEEIGRVESDVMTHSRGKQLTAGIGYSFGRWWGVALQGGVLFSSQSATSKIVVWEGHHTTIVEMDDEEYGPARAYSGVLSPSLRFNLLPFRVVTLALEGGVQFAFVGGVRLTGFSHEGDVRLSTRTLVGFKRGMSIMVNAHEDVGVFVRLERVNSWLGDERWSEVTGSPHGSRTTTPPNGVGYALTPSLGVQYRF